MIIRCRNWENDPDVCGEDCGVVVEDADLAGVVWIRKVIETAPEWFVTIRSCVEHGHHYDPYCSLGCFIADHASHAHGGDFHLVEVSG